MKNTNAEIKKLLQQGKARFSFNKNSYTVAKCIDCCCGGQFLPPNA